MRTDSDGGHFRNRTLSEIGNSIRTCDIKQAQESLLRQKWRWTSYFVIYEKNKLRRVWSIVLALLLLYTGTVFPYRLCFIEFRISLPLVEPEEEIGWSVFEVMVDVLFWCDLFVNFFFTYTDQFGREEDRLQVIVRHYLSGYFLLNLVACLPEEAVRPIFGGLAQNAMEGDEDGDDNPNSLNKLTRITRLQRTTRLARLARLMRLARLAKLVSFVNNNRTWAWLQGLRGMRVVNFVAFLFWIVHILACGWYLCAALHDDHEETWVGRRRIDLDGNTLLTRGPFEQWLHAMYYIFTVFTTVGFGDISAVTTGEIGYVTLTMLLGAIVHSIIVSEMINIVTYIDSTHLELSKHREVISGFAQHTLLTSEMREELNLWLNRQAQEGKLGPRFDREAMSDLLSSGFLPFMILRELPKHVFNGRLFKNTFLQVCLSHLHDLPPRLPTLLAMSLMHRQFVCNEVVFQAHDHPFNIFLVYEGVFACVGKPTKNGGRDEPPRSNFESTQLLGPLAAVTGRSSPNNNKGLSRPSMLTATVRDSTDADHHQEIRVMGLYPYQLMCMNSYFGEAELLSTGSRRCTVRCEDKAGGQLLVLHKQDLYRLMEEFPHLSSVWRAFAKRRDMSREERRKKLLPALCYSSANILNMGPALPYAHFAAYTIQRFFIDQVGLDGTRQATPGRSKRHTRSKRLTRSSANTQGISMKWQAEQSLLERRGGMPEAPHTDMSELRSELQHDLRHGLQQVTRELHDGLADIREAMGLAPRRAVRRSLTQNAGQMRRGSSFTDREALRRAAAPLVVVTQAFEGAMGVTSTEGSEFLVDAAPRRSSATVSQNHSSQAADMAQAVEGTKAGTGAQNGHVPDPPEPPKKLVDLTPPSSPPPEIAGMPPETADGGEEASILADASQPTYQEATHPLGVQPG